MKPPQPAVAGYLLLLGACAFDIAIQVLALAVPNPFAGIGVLVVPLLPVILAYKVTVWAMFLAGIPLALACFQVRSRSAVYPALGFALAAVTVAHGVAIARGWQQAHTAERIAKSNEAALDAEVGKCTVAMSELASAAAAYFSEPRRIVALAGNYVVQFDNGMRVQLPVRHPAPPFEDFFYGRLLGAQTRVVLRRPSAHAFQSRCRGHGSAVPDRQPHEADVYLGDRRIDMSMYSEINPPELANRTGSGVDVRNVTRWFDAHSGDRTYTTSDARPGAGYVAEAPSFFVATAPGEDRRGLFLCNVPLRRPDSPEHFLSIDPGCEKQEAISTLGYIGSVRDERTPRVLVRCLGTVIAPLRTGPRHLATTDLAECRDRRIETVLGFVKG